MLVSPALRDLLASHDGALLRDRMPGAVGGTIGKPGLLGPERARLLRGRAATSPTASPRCCGSTGYGSRSVHEPLDPFLLMLVVVIFVVLLMPVAMFVAAATRFGGEQRDRRLAAVRLVGADSGMTRRIAAGEARRQRRCSACSPARAFFLIGRQFVEFFEVARLSVYGSDVRPPLPLLVLLIVSVPLAALAMSLVALRRVVVEPLGVVRRAAARTHRRLWWRLLTPVAGVALLAPLTGKHGEFNPWQAVGGVSLVLLGVALLLPWVFDRLVGRLGAGGGLSWQMAVRRLQLSGGSSVRAVGAIAVAAAGTIALQMLFTAADAAYTKDTGQDPTRAQAITTVTMSALSNVSDPAGLDARLKAAGPTSGPHVPARRGPRRRGRLRGRGHRRLHRAARAGRAGPVRRRRRVPARPAGAGRPARRHRRPPRRRPGRRRTTSTVDRAGDRPHRHAAPGSLRSARSPACSSPRPPHRPPRADPAYISFIHLAAGDPDAAERLRNTAMAINPTMDVTILRTREADSTFASIRRGLFAGATVTLLLVGLSLLVGTIEQLRERRRTLAALVAFGTRRSTMGWSILWQTLVPVALGLVLAGALGLGLGGLLLATVDVPFHADVAGIGIVCGIAGGVVLLVTVASLPALWRLMRPDGLRFE